MNKYTLINEDKSVLQIEITDDAIFVTVTSVLNDVSSVKVEKGVFKRFCDTIGVTLPECLLKG